MLYLFKYLRDEVSRHKNSAILSGLKLKEIKMGLFKLIFGDYSQKEIKKIMGKWNGYN